MGRTAKFSDDQLREYLDLYADDPQKVARIAALFHVTPQAVTKRMAALDAKAAPKMPDVAKAAVESVFNVSTNLETVHRDLRWLIEECTGVGEKTLVYGKILDTLKLAKGCLETLYAVQEIQSFMDEVLSVIETFEPGTRERVLRALEQRRAVRAAFVQPEAAERA